VAAGHPGHGVLDLAEHLADVTGDIEQAGIDVPSSAA